MATASPTPMGSSHFGLRRPSSRQNFRQPIFRPNMIRNGPIPVTAQSQPTAHSRQYSLNDSSDDELPMPMKFSALTKALLNDDASILPQSPAAEPINLSSSTIINESARHARVGSDVLADQRARERTASPSIRENGPLPRRVVRLSGTPGSSTLRRTASMSSAVQQQTEQDAFRPESPLDLITPAPLPRTVRIKPITSSLSRGTGSSGRVSQRTNSGTRSGEERDISEDPATVARTQAAISLGSVSRYGPSTIGRTRYGDDTGMQSSMRPKRIGKVAGSFLSGPARRGRRRQSEDEQEPGQENEEGLNDAFSSQEPHSQDRALSSQETQSQESQYQDMQSSQEPEENPGSSFYASQARDYASGSPVTTSKPIRPASPRPVFQASQPEKAAMKSSPVKPQAPVYRLPAPRPDLPSAHDQENEAPPTFKKSKPTSIVLLDKAEKAAARPQVHDLDSMRANASPERKPLAPRSHNTPHRVAPPPPKMSVLQAATATAGAATASHARSKRQNIRVNGIQYTRLEVVGRGGSSKVWRVMAENNNILALKRVSLEDADENTIRGYKGEIDLLQKLKGNDRVVTMLDYEMNDNKKTLSVLMEMGELDFYKILEPRLTGENSAFDPSFTRYYWKEMLECIRAVHDHDIVHSDLKPANFVLVKGQLKLIDFGIANAIETNETVNVHRDTQIGTPNYMSPESLMDANELPGASGRISNQPKVMKIGKPSDIWSLGCILYQISYGKAPFAHIQNQMSRCRAIIDWNHTIDFPATGLGGAPLPRSLIRTMKKCLNRNQHERPSAEALLDPKDSFLNPVECDDASIPMTEELLGRILQNVASKFKDRTPSDVELLSLWPAGYFASLRKGMS